MPLDITFAVCATRQDVVNAVNILRESPYVVLDCEGVGNHLTCHILSRLTPRFLLIRKGTRKGGWRFVPNLRRHRLCAVRLPL